jgi:hypothetical protein
MCALSINSQHLALNGLPVEGKAFLSAKWGLVLLWDCLCPLPQEEAPVSFWEEILLQYWKMAELPAVRPS